MAKHARRRLAAAFVLALAGAGVPAAQTAQDKPRGDRLNLEMYLDMETVADPQLSLTAGDRRHAG